MQLLNLASAQRVNGIGIRGRLLDWVKDYLSNRTQAVLVKGEASEIQHILAGVPQGSVLGPLLFLVYINDISEGIQSVIKLFADDTSMYLSLNDPATRATILQSDLNKINQWAVQWKVKFNDAKTDLLNIIKGNTLLLPLTFGNAVLTDVTQHKHLGIT